MLGKSFLIGLVFAAISGAVVYLGVGDSSGSAIASSDFKKPSPNTKKKMLNKYLGGDDEASSKERANNEGLHNSKEGSASAAAEIIVEAEVKTRSLEDALLKTDRAALEAAKQASEAGLYLDAADIISEITTPVMRDTARSNLALALANDGEKDSALAVLDEVETEGLVAIIRSQILQALPQSE